MHIGKRYYENRNKKIKRDRCVLIKLIITNYKTEPYCKMISIAYFNIYYYAFL